MRQKVFLLISFIWSGVSLIRVSVPRRYCSILSAVNIKTKPIEISIGQKRIDFKSRVYRFVKTEATSNAVVDLYALLHVGESAYFSDIEKQLNAYDFVLYELITSVNNTDKVFGEFRLLNKDIVAVKTEMLASAFNFKTQLDMDLRKQNWYYIYLSIFAILLFSIKITEQAYSPFYRFVADIDAETVGRLEARRRGITQRSYQLSQSLGRANTSPSLFLKNFFLSDEIFTIVSRLV